MSNADIRGRFMWHELMTTDTAAAGAFYAKVLPWKTQPSPMPNYTLWLAGKAQSAGLTTVPQGGDAAPRWLTYIGVENVDDAAQQVQRLGGKILQPPADIPNYGRFALAADPQGAAFALYAPPGDRPDDSGGAAAPGSFSWHELATSDPGAALSFYAQVFGWEKGPTHDMGEMGSYQLVLHGGQQIVGIFKAMQKDVAPSWLSYVQVGDAAKAANAAKSAGGRVLHGPAEVPGGGWIAQIMDPQGGLFAVHESARPAAKPTGQVRPTRQPQPAAPAHAAAQPKAAASKAATTTSQPRPTTAAATNVAVSAKPGTAGRKKVAKAPRRGPGKRRPQAARKKGKSRIQAKSALRRGATQTKRAAGRGRGKAKTNVKVKSKVKSKAATRRGGRARAQPKAAARRSKARR